MASRVVRVLSNVSRAGAARSLVTGVRVSVPKVTVPAFKISVRAFASGEVSAVILVTVPCPFLLFSVPDSN